MHKTAKKYIFYAVISMTLLILLFVLTRTTVSSAKTEGIGAILVFIPVLPVVLIFHGVVSALLLEKRGKLAYVIASPFANLAVALAMIYVANFGEDMSIWEVLGGFFEYPVYIITSIYLSCGWLGMAAVYIFKKLRTVLERIYKI